MPLQLNCAEVRELVGKAMDDAEAQIIYRIKTQPEMRKILLPMLDAMEQVKADINARIEYLSD